MARWQPVPIVGGSYSDETRPWSHQDTVNWLPMRAERPGGRSTEMLRDVPGLFPFAQAGNGPIRGARDVEGRLFVVSGNKLYQVGTDASATELGTIPGSGLVSMAHNQLGLDGGNELIVGTVSSGYTYNVKTGSFAQITDPGFPGIQSVDFIGGYIVGIEPQRRYWLHSALADARSYNTTDIYSAEAAPDKLVGLLVLNGEVVVVGERTTEFFVNSPSGTAAFQRATGVSNDKGCASPHTLRKLDNSAFMLGSDGIVYRLDGYRWVRVSHHPLEQVIARCDISRALAYTYEDRGHAIYYLTLPDGQTWGYDVSQGEWARRESYGFDRWRVNTLTRWNGGWYAGDFANGLIYLVDWDYHREGIDPLVRTRRTAVLHDNGNRVFVNAVKLNVDTGQPAPIIADLAVTGAMVDGAVGDAVSGAYTGTGGIKPYTFTVTAGALPAGVTLDADGTYSGTFNGGGTGAVSFAYAWTVTVTDAEGDTATVNDAVTVTNLVVSGALPDAEVGVAITAYDYATQDGVGAITYTVDSGALPTGLSLSIAGQVTGTPTTGGTFTWTVRGTDTEGNFDTHADTADVSVEMFALTRSTASPATSDDIWFSADAATWPDANSRSPSIDECALGAFGLDLNIAMVLHFNSVSADVERITDFTTTPLVPTIPSLVAAIERARKLGGIAVLCRAAATDHFRYSTDDGQTWTATEIPATGVPTSSPSDMARLDDGRWLTSGSGTAPEFFYADTDNPPAVGEWVSAGSSATATGMPICCNGTAAVLFKSGGSDFYRTTDGASWSTIVLATHNASGNDCIAIGDVMLYTQAASGNTRILRSTDAGLTWATVVLNAGVADAVNRFAYAEGVVVAAAGNIVYRSTDDGATWTASTLPFVADPADAVRVGVVRRVP